MQAARRAPAGGFLDVVEGRIEAFLAAQPVDVLPVPEEMLRRLRLLGIETLGGLAALPRSALAAQFGPLGSLAWAFATLALALVVYGATIVTAVASGSWFRR